MPSEEFKQPLPGPEMLTIERHGNESFLWKGILEARKLCVTGAGILTGNGETNLWTKPVVPGSSPEECGIGPLSCPGGACHQLGPLRGFSWSMLLWWVTLGSWIVQVGTDDERVITCQAVCSVNSVLEAELEAIHLAMVVAIEERVSSVQIISDSAIVVQALKVQELPLAWGSYPIFRQCVSLFQSFSCITFNFTPRVENFVVDRLAYLARVNNVCKKLVVREAVPLVATL
uniref:RNase H type-1 domain-containing protein n=1 Tax=Cannabis sativa TaxID=3483 RepID=A0A803PLT1_CANSA